jgi:ribosome-binding protein aMBF1 (putative translation factor)
MPAPTVTKRIPAAPAPTVTKRLPDALRAARTNAGLSREAVAAALDRSMSSIVGYEGGRILPPLNVIEELAALYGVRLADLFDDRPNHAAA